MPDQIVSLRKAAPLPAPSEPAPGDAALAYQLNLAGADWISAARQSGFADETSAALAVTALLSKVAVLHADEQRADKVPREVDRLNHVQLQWWGAATKGAVLAYDADGDPIIGLDDKAANIVIKTIMARAKLLGLDVPATAGATKVQTIVIQGTSEEYIAALTRIAEDN